MNTRPFSRRLSHISALTVLAIAGLTICPKSQADRIEVTFGAPGEQAPDNKVIANAQIFGIETFNDRSGTLGTNGFATNFLTDHKGGVISGRYVPSASSGTTFPAANVFGGSTLQTTGTTGNATRFLSVAGGRSVTVTWTTTGATGENYFGLWISALDANNILMFKEGSTPVFTFTPTDLIAALGDCRGLSGNGGTGTGNQGHCGNPNPQWSNSADGNNGPNGGRGNREELYAFVNFFDTNGLFNSVTISQDAGSPIYESDNHSVGFCLDIRSCITGTPVTPTPIPEPATWSLFGIAFTALAGVVYRRPKWLRLPD